MALTLVPIGQSKLSAVVMASLAPCSMTTLSGALVIRLEVSTATEYRLRDFGSLSGLPADRDKGIRLPHSAMC